MNASFAGFAALPISGAGVTAIYAQLGTSKLAYAADLAAATKLPDTSLPFVLNDAANCLLRVHVFSYKSSGGSRFFVYDNAAQILPVNSAGFGGWGYLALPGPVGNIARFSAIITLAAGAHSLDIYWNAVSTLAAITFYDRFLSVEVLAA